jgi:hypothetical protein
MRRGVGVTIVLVSVLAAAPRAVQLELDARAIQEAIAIGQSRIDGERARFHAPYRLTVATAPVDDIEVITPFRRIVLDAQGEAEIGNRTYGQRNALEALAAAPDVLEFDIELTFHPLNTYIGVPDYQVALLPPGGSAPRLEPQTIDRVPRYGPRVAGIPLPHPRPGGLTVNGRSGPMLGGTVVARYNARLLDVNGRYDVVVSEDGRELARARVDLRGLR